MSILSDIGTKVGTEFKKLLNKISTLESVDIDRYSLSNHHIGGRYDYYRAVLPLCEVDNSNPDKFSYTSGRFDFIRSNGCCSQLPMHVEIKMQKKYNTASPMWFIMHNNLPSNARPCTFTKNGQLYGGLEVYHDQHESFIYFNGITTLNALYNTTDIGWEYLNATNNSVTDTEIKNSLVIL